MILESKTRIGSTLRNIVVASLFIAISVTLGKALESVPNIELISFSVWMSSYILSKKYSMVVGILSFSIYSVLSPYGIAPLPLLASQAIGGGLIGFFGGSFIKSKKVSYIGYMLFGFVLTFVYDLITNLGGFIAFSENSSTLIVYLIGGLTFSIVHIVCNSAVFMLLTPLMKKTIDKIYKA